MYTAGSVKETLAFIDGYRFGNTSPISGRLFGRFVCIRNSFPSNYAWTYVIQSCSPNDHEAFKLIQETITEFVHLKETLSDDELLEYAARQETEEGDAHKVFREFDRALLLGKEELIKPLIQENKDASILWQGASPSDVATQLNEIADSQPVKCIPSSDDENKVNIIAPGWPFPVEMNLVNGQWKIDAAKIIALRKHNKSA